MGKKIGHNMMNRLDNMKDIIKQAQKMQKKMTEHAEELSVKEFEGTAGGGAIVVKCNGSRRILSVKFNDIIDFNDIEMVEDLIVAATNDALSKVDAAAASGIDGVTSGFNLNGFGENLSSFF